MQNKYRKINTKLLLFCPYQGHQGRNLTRYRGGCVVFRAKAKGPCQGYMALLYTQRGETLIRKSLGQEDREA